MSFLNCKLGKDEIVNSVISYLQNENQKRAGKMGKCSRVRFDFSRERESHFFLDSWLIRPSEFVGIRRNAVLRSEGFAWVPVLRSFNKLREVGVLSYLLYS